MWMIRTGRELAPQEVAWEMAVGNGTVTLYPVKLWAPWSRATNRKVSSVEGTVFNRVDNGIATDTPRSFPRTAEQDLLFCTRLTGSCPLVSTGSVFCSEHGSSQAKGWAS